MEENQLIGINETLNHNWRWETDITNIVWGKNIHLAKRFKENNIILMCKKL